LLSDAFNALNIQATNVFADHSGAACAPSYLLAAFKEPRHAAAQGRVESEGPVGERGGERKERERRGGEKEERGLGILVNISADAHGCSAVDITYVVRHHGALVT